MLQALADLLGLVQQCLPHFGCQTDPLLGGQQVGVEVPLEVLPNVNEHLPLVLLHLHAPLVPKLEHLHLVRHCRICGLGCQLGPHSVETVVVLVLTVGLLDGLQVPLSLRLRFFRVHAGADVLAGAFAGGLVETLVGVGTGLELTEAFERVRHKFWLLL